MHYQTRGPLWSAAAKVFGSAGALLKRQSRLRLLLMAALAACLLANIGPHPLAFLENLWSGEAADTVPILVAGGYLPAFQVVKPEGVRVRNYPKDFVPPGALHTKAELVTEAGAYGYSTIVSVPEGEPLTRTILVEVGKDHGLSSLLRLGKVAVSFSIDKSRAAGGWIQPGDTVALFETLPPAPLTGTTYRKKTQLLLSAVKVLAVDKEHLGQKSDPAEKSDVLAQLTSVESDSHMMTVLVNPAEAAALVEARERGPLSVVLRAVGDDLPWSITK